MVYLWSLLQASEPHMRLLSQCYQHVHDPRSWTAGNHICSVDPQSTAVRVLLASDWGLASVNDFEI